jgi:hypothetical protein
VLGAVRDEQNQPVAGAFVLLCLHQMRIPNHLLQGD